MKILLIVFLVLALAYVAGALGIVNVAHFSRTEASAFNGALTYVGIKSGPEDTLPAFGNKIVLDSHHGSIHFESDIGLESSTTYILDGIAGSLYLDSLQLSDAWVPFYKPAKYSAKLVTDSLYFKYPAGTGSTQHIYALSYQLSGNLHYFGICSNGHARQVLFDLLCADIAKWLQNEYKESYIRYRSSNH